MEHAHDDGPGKHASRIRFIYLFGTIFIGALLLGVNLGLMISADPPSTAPPTVIDWEGLEAYNINEIRYANPSDSDSIQDAVDDLYLEGRTGGIVVVPPGDYTLTSSLVLHSNMALVGSGPKTKLSFTSDIGAGFTGLNIYASATTVLVKDLWIDGFGAGSGTQCNGIGGAELKNVTITNCIITDWSDDAIVILGPNSNNNIVSENIIYDCHEGLEIKGGHNNIVTNNNVFRITDEACEISDRLPWDQRTYGHVVTGNVFRGGSYGITLYGNVSDTVISDNFISGVAGLECIISSSYSYPERITISNNIFDGTTSNHAYGINFVSPRWRDILISNNQIFGYQYGVGGNGYGIRVPSAGTNLTIVGNYIHEIGGTACAGIRLSTTGIRNVSIKSNTFANIQKAGVYPYGTDQPLYVVGNTFLNCGEAGVKVYTDNNLIVGNSFVTHSVSGVFIEVGKNTTIIGNSMTLSPWGVRSLAGTDYTYIIGNCFKGCTTAITSLSGSNNVVVNNTGI